jgi:hypothetical protein
MAGLFGVKYLHYDDGYTTSYFSYLIEKMSGFQAVQGLNGEDFGSAKWPSSCHGQFHGGAPGRHILHL